MQIGLGTAADPGQIGLDVFTHETAGALEFLADSPGINRSRPTVRGHSEEPCSYCCWPPTPIPRTWGHGTGLLESLTKRYLVLLQQVEAQVPQQRKSGVITTEFAEQVSKAMTKAIAQLRTEATVPVELPCRLSSLFALSPLILLRQASWIDPLC